MSTRPGIIVIIVAAFALLFGGQYLGWFGKRQGSANSPAPSRDSESSPAPTKVAISTPPPSDPVSPTPVATPPPRSPGRSALIPPPATATPATATITDWEQRIDDLLTADGEENIKARQLLEILPKLPEDGQVEAVQHISNLLPDEEYASLAPTLKDPQTPEAVLDVLMTDVLNRPNAIKLDTLLDVARVPNHPKGEEARDVLEVYVDENYGTDWAAWDAAVKKWLQENPDE